MCSPLVWQSGGVVHPFTLTRNLGELSSHFHRAICCFAWVRHSVNIMRIDSIGMPEQLHIATAVRWTDAKRIFGSSDVTVYSRRKFMKTKDALYPLGKTN